MSDDHQTGPALRIVRGDPTPEELAVVTALITASADVGADTTLPATRPRGRWNDPGYGHRRYWLQGIDGWRTAR